MSETTLKRRAYQIVEEGRDGDRASRLFDGFILTAIIVSIVGLVLGTVERYGTPAQELFNSIEIVTVGIFTVEWLLRVWCSVEDPSGKYRHPVWGRLRYSVSPMALVDLVAILPFYLILVIPTQDIDFRVLRVVRLVARIIRLSRHSETISVLGRVLHNIRQELFAVVGIIALLLLVVSSLMYFAEHDAQPDKFPSIPAATYWAIITLTTVGYGDTVPITMFGRLLTAIVAVLGIGLIALPAGILGSGFMEETRRYRQDMRSENRCPHCGELLPAD